MSDPDGTRVRHTAYRKPALEAGDYSVVAEQRIAVRPGARESVYRSEARFVVSGARFSIDPALVHACYPPRGALGRFSAVFPHVALDSPTLPWERSAYAREDTEPWLVLLVIDETELRRGEVIVPPAPSPLGALAARRDFPYRYRASDADTDPEELVATVAVRPSLLATLMPDGRALALQAHVRERIESDGRRRERSIVFANRLPRAGATSLCFLVSVEGLYDERGRFRTGRTGGEAHVPLVHLARWRFASLADGGEDFEESVERLSTGALVRPTGSASPNATAAARLAGGAVPLQHQMRTGDRTWSWYRGPLSPLAAPDTPSARGELPAFADALVAYHHGEGLFDVTHAAAFSLGRALAIDDGAFTVELHDWKRRYNRTLLAALEYENTRALLAGTAPPALAHVATDPASPLVGDWLRRLAGLETVPFNYLVPDAAMLPPESLRFFRLDGDWIDSLLCGAFSVGVALRDELLRIELPARPTVARLRAELATAFRSTADELRLDYDETTRRGTVSVHGVGYPLRLRGGIGTGGGAGTLVVRYPGAARRLLDGLTGGVAGRRRGGVLIRSRLVSGWPEMRVDAFAAAVRGRRARPASLHALPVVRAARLADDVLLLLFEGEPQMLECYLKPDGLRFGLDERADGTLEKELAGGGDTLRVSASWHDESRRVVDIGVLATAIAEARRPRGARRVAPDSATFGMQLFEGASKGRFTIAEPS